MAAESRTGGRSGLLNQVCTSAALDAALDEMDREYELQRRHLNYSFDDASSSDLESFVSALDVCMHTVFSHVCEYLLSAWSFFFKDGIMVIIVCVINMSELFCLSSL